MNREFIDKYVLSASLVPGNVLGPGNMTVNRMRNGGEILPSWRILSDGGR